jgi:biofilm PGA synthesis N-glycosyltransferase PgaC
MDLTWSLYQAQWRVRFMPDALCHPIEPHDLKFLGNQLKRWSHGFIQNVKLHWRGVLAVPFLRTAIAVSLWDATIASFVYLVLLPVLAIVFANPWFLLGYLLDLPALAVPVLVGAIPRGEGLRAIISLPAFFVLRTVNAVYFLRAAITEFVLRRSFRVYVKGH